MAFDEGCPSRPQRASAYIFRASRTWLVGDAQAAHRGRRPTFSAGRELVGWAADMDLEIESSGDWCGEDGCSERAAR